MNELMFQNFAKYRNLGWHLAPCSKEKFPAMLGKGGWYNASPDTSQWMAWDRQYPDCLWGCRPVGGFCVLDADIKHEGVELLKRLESENETLPRTPTARTGGGGRHRYFTCESSLNGKKINGCDGLEVIAITKGIIVPPSIHPNGVPYEWEIAPWDLPMAPLPAWLILLMGRSEVVKSSPPEKKVEADFTWGGGGFDHLGSLPEGGRNTPVSDAIVYEKLSGVSEEECTEKAMAWATENNYDEAEMRRKIRSLYGNENFVPKDTSFLPAPTPEPEPEPISIQTKKKIGCDAHGDCSTLNPEAYHGLLGEMLRAVENEMESSPAGALLGWMTLLGNVVGRGAWFSVKERPHHPAIFLAMVGGSGDGKEDTWDVVIYPFSKVETEWSVSRIKGIGSGEGLIEQVDDKSPDKRFVARLSELSRALKQQRREGSTLSEVIREAWDGKRISIPNRKENALSATDYSISIIADITPTVLRKLLDKGTEGEDGWANRFLWCVVKSLRDISDGGNLHVLDTFLPRLEAVIAHGKCVGEMKRDAEADDLWRSVYGSLKRSGDAVPHTDRARPYVLRMAMLYAVADLSSSIGLAHLKAALALWEYCVESARELFSAHETPLTIRLLQFIQANPNGIPKEAMTRKFRNGIKAADIDEALASLHEKKMAHPTWHGTGGRKAEVWHQGRSDTTSLLLDGEVGQGRKEVSSPLSALPKDTSFLPTQPEQPSAKDTSFLPNHTDKEEKGCSDFVWGEVEPKKVPVVIEELVEERGIL